VVTERARVVAVGYDKSVTDRNRKGGRMGHGELAPEDQMMTPGEVAALFRVDPRTVTRWAKIGKLPSVRTPGGHRRYRKTEVRALFASGADGPTAAEMGA
jgi:excisionase family DNA binding protein